VTEKPVLKFGIAGHPRGATTFASVLFEIGHETVVPGRGIADYLLAQSEWPTEDRYAALGRREAPTGLPTLGFSFEHKLTVVREPWRVLAASWAILPQDVAWGMAWCYPDLRSVPREAVDLDFVATLLIRWYRSCLVFSAGKFFQAEAPLPASMEQLLDEPRPAPPPTTVNTMLGSYSHRLLPEEIAPRLSASTLKEFLILRDQLGYGDLNG